jgi:hypothetical protein
VKHYVRTIADLKDQGGEASGYARDLRNDIYWATQFQQQTPLGCGEFLYPEGRQRSRECDIAFMMGLQTRGYRLANWYDIRPYNPSMIGFLNKEGTRPGFEEAYEIIRKSFAPVAVFDKAYDALGPYPAKPQLPAAQPVALAARLPVHEDCARCEKALGRAAALDFGKRGQEAVEPLAGGLVRNASLHARAAAGWTCGPRPRARAAGPPPRRR